MVRIYAIIEEFNPYYMSRGASKISLTPFDCKCCYIDLESDIIYKTFEEEGEDPFDWKPYNTTLYLPLFLYNPNTKDIIEVIEKWDDGDGNLIYQLANYDEVDSSNYPDYLCLSDYDLVYKEGVLVEMKPC